VRKKMMFVGPYLLSFKKWESKGVDGVESSVQGTSLL
jgi:hypothetical protein